MKLATFDVDGRAAWGAVQPQDGTVADVSMLAGAPAGVRELFAQGVEEGLAWARHALATAPRLALDSVRLRAPVPQPQKFLALGGNYQSHLDEAARIGLTLKHHGQTWFNKQVSCIAGPYDDVHKPFVSDQFDYEGELGVVIGRRCRHVRAQDALGVIAGYVVANDLSVRDWQMRSPTHTLGKSFDTHGPLGPWLVTRDELGDARGLRLQAWVNGEPRQDGNTSEMLHRIEDMVVELSTCFTLLPGDVLVTGSPAGVGGLMDPPRYLRVGDVVKVAIEGIGHIENRVIPEPLPA